MIFDIALKLCQDRLSAEHNGYKNRKWQIYFSKARQTWDQTRRRSPSFLSDRRVEIL